MTTATQDNHSAVPVDTKGPYIQRLFSTIASRYDVFNRLVTFGMDVGWRDQAMALGDVQPGHAVLDVCAGTGDLAFLAAKTVTQSGTVISMDFNAEMLQNGQRRPIAQKLPVSWLQADAMQIPFPAASFDRVTIGFSTRNLVDLNQGLSEMVRVLKPGGRLIILETGRPSNPIVRLGYFMFLFTVAPVIGFLLTGKTWPFTYLARSVKVFITPSQMCERLDKLNVESKYVALSGGLASLFIASKDSQS